MKSRLARLAAIENVIKQANAAASVTLVPECEWERDPGPPVTFDEEGHLTIRYPAGMRIDKEDVDEAIANLIPDGPDRDRLVEKGQGAARKLIITYEPRGLDGRVREVDSAHVSDDEWP